MCVYIPHVLSTCLAMFPEMTLTIIWMIYLIALASGHDRHSLNA